MRFIILAGGSGTRLWPKSRRNFPKQFLILPDSDRLSFFQRTIKRFAKVSKKDFLVVTKEDYKFYVVEQLNKVLTKTDNVSLIFEPTSRNTAPAIALALKYAIKNSEDEIFFVTPTDHMIEPEEDFLEYLSLAEDIASQGYIVTFGIPPTKPDTGYGYIKIKDEIFPNVYQVEKFEEKPDYHKAKEYVSQSNYFWNSGMFTFRASVMIEEFKRYVPELGDIFDMSYEEVLRIFPELPNISIDYAVMEKTDKAVLIPIKTIWSDIGSWDSLYEILKKDKDRNVLIGKTELIETKRSFIFGSKRLIATIGVNDLIIIDTDDALLISKRGKSHKVKDIVKNLLEKSSQEAIEQITSYRPWGYFTVLEKGDRYKIKKITVNPGAKISLQLHHHRSEHWIVVKGTAKVRIGDREIYVHENESIYVPKSTLHRLENPGLIPLEIIEVQVGEYIEEDDIKRYNDIYGR